MNTVAIVGASTDRGKFGNKAVRAFLKAGWEVYPVNPTGGEIEGLSIYTKVSEVPSPIDLVTVYVPPAIAIRLLPQIKELGPKQLFLNPGADTPDVMAAARKLGLEPVRTCSIVYLGYSPGMFPA